MTDSASSAKFDVLIVGGGHGGAQTAIALRQAKFTGTIAIVSNENVLPYERPPLSKEYLSGDKPFERILIRPSTFWKEREITILFETQVCDVLKEQHEVVTADGLIIGYGQLVWAAGGSARRLVCEGGDATGVHTVRTQLDVDLLASELDSVKHVVVVGGGYIGLETAAILNKLGKQVTVLEALDRVLARVAGVPLSRFYEAEHRAHGVDIRLNVIVDHIETSEGRVVGVHLVGGEVLSCQMVIVGIGIVPSIEPLNDGGAICSNGVEVDQWCRTNLADVFAVGDCAAHENSYADGARIRLESVQNANDQATLVAQKIAGETVTPYASVPWFWSHQYDLKLQTVGLSMGHDEAVVRGDPASRSFSVIYLRQGHVIALDCVNSVKDYVQGKALVVNKVQSQAHVLADTNTALKEIASGYMRQGH